MGRWSPSTIGSFLRCLIRLGPAIESGGLARATLIVEAGLPSGTFSTADEALVANREVLVVPGPITSPTSLGANRLIYQGATPIIDSETFEDTLFGLFGCLRREESVRLQEKREGGSFGWKRGFRRMPIRCLLRLCKSYARRADARAALG